MDVNTTTTTTMDYTSSEGTVSAVNVTTSSSSPSVTTTTIYNNVISSPNLRTHPEIFSTPIMHANGHFVQPPPVAERLGITDMLNDFSSTNSTHPSTQSITSDDDTSPTSNFSNPSIFNFWDSSKELDLEALQHILFSMAKQIHSISLKMHDMQTNFNSTISTLEQRIKYSFNQCKTNFKSVEKEFQSFDQKLQQHQFDRLKDNDEMSSSSLSLEPEGNHGQSHSQAVHHSHHSDDVFPERDARRDDPLAFDSTNQLRDDIDFLFNKFYDLDCRVVECEQYSRRESLIISGIPSTVRDNDLEDTVIEIVNELGWQIRPIDICAVHRLGKPSRNSRYPRRVIVRFVNRKVVNFCMENKKRLGELKGVLRMNLRFYESLCQLNQETLRVCDWLKDEEVIHHHFLRNGFVKIVIEDGQPPIRIKHPEMLLDKFDIPDHVYSIY